MQVRVRLRVTARIRVRGVSLRHHRSDAYSAKQVLLNKRQIYGGAPKVNCYWVRARVNVGVILQRHSAYYRVPQVRSNHRIGDIGPHRSFVVSHRASQMSQTSF